MARQPRKPAPKPANQGGSPSESNRPAVAILGTGQMGLVCAAMLAAGDRGSGAGDPTTTPKPTPPLERPRKPRPATLYDVVLWGHDPEESGELSQTRRSPRLPDFRLPDAVRVSIDDARALERATLIVSAIPVQFIRETWLRLREHVRPDAAVVSVAKGIENETLLRPTQVLGDVLGDDQDRAPRRLGVLSGPTIAGELARCLPATMIAASDDAAFAREVQRLFSSSWLRVYTNADVLGVEVAGATKNVVAIAAGILDGLAAGANAKSALLARGLVEITRLGVAMGASRETFFGLAGVGDLATSCFSPEGRNRSCGEALGRGEKLEAYLKRTRSVVEGVPTARSVVDLARKFRVDMPIAQAVHAVLFEGLDPLAAITGLMSRELKSERVG
ncbi:MAG: NAD(P)H-dependent glycerol-3-phosphate dehydrogenase [Phycisphaerales bacterium]